MARIIDEMGKKIKTKTRITLLEAKTEKSYAQLVFFSYLPDSRIQAVTLWPMRWVKARLKVL